MVDVKNKTCQEEGCTKGPVFNNPGENQAKYCWSHIKEGMINVRDK